MTGVARGSIVVQAFQPARPKLSTCRLESLHHKDHGRASTPARGIRMASRPKSNARPGSNRVAAPNPEVPTR